MKTILDIDGHYEILCSVSGSSGEKKIFLGKTGKCRFCDNVEPSFRQNTHTFPEALGNKWVFSKDECDACNALFSKYETALIDCLRPLLTVGGIKGKRKVPQSGRSAGYTYVRHDHQDGKRHLSWSSKVPDFRNIISKNPFTNIIKFKLPVPSVPFVPRFAYKALAKMAFSLLPENEISKFSKLRNWLQNQDDTVDSSTLDVFISFASIGNAPSVVAGVLLRRVDKTDQLPYIVFLFMAGSICFQINMMSDSMEKQVETGSVKIRWKTTIQGGDSKSKIILSYSEPHYLNWVTIEPRPQPLESLELEFNLINCQASLKPVFRTP